MPYRRTGTAARKLATRRAAILAAAQALAAEGGMAELQIAPLAARAGIAAGTVYRYFPSKTELIAALVAVLADDELAALRGAADAAPGPLSGLTAAIALFAARALSRRRLAAALLVDPAEPEIAAARLAFRATLGSEFAARITRALAGGHIPDQDAALAARALIGALIEGLIGPLAPAGTRDRADVRAEVQAMTLVVLRALGVADARARGLVVQAALPQTEKD